MVMVTHIYTNVKVQKTVQQKLILLVIILKIKLINLKYNNLKKQSMMKLKKPQKHKKFTVS